MSKENDGKNNDDKEEIKDANIALGAGAGLGAYAGITLTTVGTACPLCVVVAPALIGLGLYKRHKVKKRKTEKENSEEQCVKLD